MTKHTKIKGAPEQSANREFRDFASISSLFRCLASAWWSAYIHRTMKKAGLIHFSLRAGLLRENSGPGRAPLLDSRLGLFTSALDTDSYGSQCTVIYYRRALLRMFGDEPHDRFTIFCSIDEVITPELNIDAAQRKLGTV
jgi:hypothetical protein